MEKEMVVSSKAPKAIGPYSQAMIHGEYAFLSGMLPIQAETGEMVTGDVTAQTKQIMENIKSLLEDIGSSLEQVLKTTIFLNDLADFQAVNDVYGQYFINSLPARSCVEVSRIPKDALIEIEVIAVVSK